MATFTGKVAIITGASRGIGRAIAEKLGQEGAHVVVNYTKSADKAQEVVAAIEASGGQALAVQADITQIADVRRLFEEAHERFGAPHIVVSNAGGAITFKPVADMTEEEYDQTFALNTKSAFFVAQEAARRVQDGGRIIAISTGGTSAPGPNGSAYVGSKAAVEQFIYALAKELGARQITANIISSGITETDGLVAPKEMVNQMIAMTPLGRLGQPADIAEVVAFFASDAARWVTGQNIHAAGGLV